MAHSKSTRSQEMFLQQVFCIIAAPIYKCVYGYSQRRACSEAAPFIVIEHAGFIPSFKPYIRPSRKQKVILYKIMPV